MVTCNYPARHAGVTKLMNIDEAKKKCVSLPFSVLFESWLLLLTDLYTSRPFSPSLKIAFHLVVFFALRIFLLTLSLAQPQLILVPGEDLTPYRKASASVFNVLCEFGSASQKLGMDEVAHTPTCMCTNT